MHSCLVSPSVHFEKHVVYVNEGEKCFTLRSQDLCAAPLVSLWADAQRFIAAGLEAGQDLGVLCREVEARLKRVFLDVPADGRWADKIESAYQIAEQMEAYPGKKLAD